MIFDIRTKEKNEETEISEKKLQSLIVENFNLFFPELKIIKSEYAIKGNVRLFGMSGRIDILAYNPVENNLVIFELKKEHSRNIVIQAIDYSDFIEENLELIISRIDELSIEEKKIVLQLNKPPKIILVANSFYHPTIRRAKRLTNEISLYQYIYYSNQLLQFEEIKDNSKIKERIESISYSSESLDHIPRIVEIIKTIIGLDLLNERYYKIEGRKLTVNQSHLFKSYEKYYSGKGMDFLSKMDFVKSIKESNRYIGSSKGVRYKNNNTSGIIINLS
ncbi:MULTISPECIES: hypothetical protein [unclassified Maribacter]|uniref:hypothetical protein n=1 Tax=unclassified Maribacter TaxID=2615042 RepID=UPI00257C8CCB|nr:MULTISPECIES: hypothetical protein [unclassified Maribacter]|tara:strand:- start:35099 stop:35929 length:831 start_codon:yes stop_codon:yes gene_type:complete